MKQTRNGKPVVDLSRIAVIGEKLRQMADELILIFPERRHLIQQIIYALLTKEHVLVWGTYGTGKTDLLRTLFGVFRGARIFSIGFSKFMSEASIIGIPDPKRMREQGEVIYRRDGGILDADFAELDELFDSNAPLLRTLLGILNERQFKRGRQAEEAKLHTAVACTNGDPMEELKKHPELGAVVDRFLFQCRVEYLKSAESRRRMYAKFLTGERPSVSIDLDDLKYVSSIVVDANQITDPHFVEVYDELIGAYLKQIPTQVISDRRRCKLLQLVEANALLYGRYEVDFEDLMAIRWGLCTGYDDGQHDPFKAVADPIIAKAKETKKQNIDEVQLKLLAEFKLKIPPCPDSACSSDKLVELSRQLTKLRKDVSAVKPQLPSTEDEKKKMLASIDGIRETVRKLTEGV
ncbi:MAG: AAA family ATPase [bacterium]|nr:AAA family ATPase [bacterium]